jgi:hypothetical protein
MRGLATTEQAMVTRRFWPPEMPRWRGVPILFEAMADNPSELRVASMC